MLKRFAVAAATVFGVGLVASNYVTKKAKESYPDPSPSQPNQVVRVTIIDKDSGEFLIANVQVVNEDHDGEGRYRFHMTDGRFFDLDLSEGEWQIIRRKTAA